MDRASWFKPEWLWLKRCALVAALGVIFAAIGIAAKIVAIAVLGLLLIVPLIFWMAFIPILHWKDRYVGDSSKAWGAFLVFETSSWSKLFYWFIHVLPDWRRSGRYADVP